MLKLIRISLLLLPLLVACSTAGPDPVATPAPSPVVASSTPKPLPSDTAESMLAPTDPAAEPLASPSPITEVAAPADTATVPPLTGPAPTLPAPTATAGVVVNGPYEGTYFRGREDAPVTMIDYSDFL